MEQLGNATLKNRAGALLKENLLGVIEQYITEARTLHIMPRSQARVSAQRALAYILNLLAEGKE